MTTQRVAALLLLFAATAFAQVRENITVSLIEVPVMVVDSRGNPVRGLTAANFEVYDQGKKREITSFDTLDFAVRGTANAPMNPAARRSFLLLFDLGYSSPASLARAQDAARRFVKESVQPRDLVGVGTIDVDRGFRLLAAFTTDRELVASAIDSPRSFRGTDPLQIANQRSTFEVQEFHLQGETDHAPPPPGGEIARENREAAHQHEQDASDNMKRQASGNVRKRIEKQVDALGEMARALSSVPGRKQVIYLSEGFDATFLQGRAAAKNETFQQRTDNNRENDQAIRGEVWTIDSDARYGNSAGLTLLDKMAGYFRNSDVVLHAVDIKGVRVQSDVTEGQTGNSNAGLFALARPTGGMVFENSNSLTGDLARLLHAQEVVYVLGFQAPVTKAGAVHPLRVKVVGASASYVSYRNAYTESGPESAAEAALTDAEIIMNDVPRRDVRVDALSAALPGDATRAQVPVVLEINGEDLLKVPPKDGNAMAELYVYAFDRDGAVRDRLFEKMRLDMAKAGDRLRNAGVKWIGMLNLPPGDYAVKALVHIPNSERRGFARADVHVPAAGEIVATPFFVDLQPRQWVLVRGTTVDPQRFPFQIGSESLMPSAAARVKKGEARRFALFVSGAGVDDLTVDATLGSEPPRVVAQGEDFNMAKLVFDCDTAGLAVGPAALRITVHRKGTNDVKTTLPLVVSE
jgi:VWFA-related protein